MPELNDGWAAGAAYEEFMGRWSRLLARRFVSWLSMRPAAHWLDVGCGMGALADAICSAADPASVVGCDPSEAFVEYARRRQADPRVTFVVAGVGQLPTCPGGFDSVTSLLALNFFPKPEAAIDEMRRITAVNGLVSACVWDYAGGMELLMRFWDSVGAVDSGAAELDEGRRFPICRPDALGSLFREAGIYRGRLRLDRDPHPVLHLRRALEAIPGRHGPRSVLRCKPRLPAPRGAGHTARAFASSGARWRDLAGRQSLGRARSRTLEARAR